MLFLRLDSVRPIPPIEPGRTVHFVSKRLWMRLGAPWNVDAWLNGKPTVLPAQTGDAVVTARGVAAPAPG